MEGGTNQSPFPVSDVPHSSELGTVLISALVAWHSWTVLGCVSMILVCCLLRWCWIWEGIFFLNSQQLRGGKSHSGSADSQKVVLYTLNPNATTTITTTKMATTRTYRTAANYPGAINSETFRICLYLLKTMINILCLLFSWCYMNKKS